MVRKGYLISCKIAKKVNPGEMDLPYLKLHICNQGQDARHVRSREAVAFPPGLFHFITFITLYQSQ
jgi:hypothetical protein